MIEGLVKTTKPFLISQHLLYAKTATTKCNGGKFVPNLYQVQFRRMRNA